MTNWLWQQSNHLVVPAVYLTLSAIVATTTHVTQASACLSLHVHPSKGHLGSSHSTKRCVLQVDLMYGFLYESYRPKYYFWEAIILLEKLCLAICVTLLQQHTAAVQVLLAMAVIFVASVAQVGGFPALMLSCNHSLTHHKCDLAMCSTRRGAHRLYIRFC